MKNTKKWLALLLSLAMALSLTACGGGAPAGTDSASAGNEENAAENTEDAASAPEDNGEENAEEAAGEAADETTGGLTDLQYVQDKGSLIIGITEFEPMDYQDTDGNWIGFDADLAVAFADSLGVQPQFQLIDWDNKVFELNGKTIDVVWNGMTLTDEVKSAMECSAPYFNNAQVVVVKEDRAAEIDSPEAAGALSFAVENGSAGMEQAEAYGFNYTAVMDQATALLEVSSGTADAAIIDFLMAKAMTGEGTSYADLIATISLNSEEYGVGFRQGSDLAAALNDFFHTAYENGQMTEIAERYNIAEALIAQ